jgi:hypothetical protein
MWASNVATSVSLLASAEQNNFGDTRGGAVAGPLGLFVISLLALGMVLLVRNMSKRLRRLPRSFDDDRQL